MGVITGGKVIGDGNPSVKIPGSKPKIYWTEAVPTDANIGFDGTPPNGTLAGNVLNGQVYERQSAVWTRVDTV